MNPQQFEKSRRDKYDGELVNERIRFNEVLLIGPDGEKLGVMSSQKALYEARDRDLDLICVSPNAKPPVCKIVNYGKYRFQKQKKAKEAKKNQKIIETKEIQLSPKIGEHDIQTKVKACNKFLQEGNKVKVGVKFKGRELTHPEIGEEVLKKFLSYVSENGIIEKQPVLDGKWLTCTLASKLKK